MSILPVDLSKSDNSSAGGHQNFPAYKKEILVDSTGPSNDTAGLIDPEIEEPGETDNSSEFGTDISAMFNERGYSKSNKVSYDESEMINDFNFNLMYNFPLYNFKGKGEMDINLSLAYNGSVAHQFICAYAADGRSTNLEIPKYNINSPEWIINFNGIGVQTFNFETDWFTYAPSNQTVSNNDVHLLTTGYQITDNLTNIIGTQNHDYINILAGDGSLITLENTIGGRYYGTYYSSNKRDYTIGIVDFDLDGTNCQGYYRNRKLDLMKGDGLVYTFTEYKIPYADYDKPTSCTFGNVNSPQVFLLTYVKDKFGHYVYLDYEFPHFFNQGIKGRPVLKQITSNLESIGNITFEYFAPNAVRINNAYKGNFLFNMSEYMGPSGHYRRPYVNFFIDPLGRTITCQNSPYTRNSNSCKYLGSGSSTFNASVNLYRMTALTNYNGGKKAYTYLGSTTLGINNNVAEGQKIHSDEHHGQGRDIFFTNMVGTKNVYHNSTDVNPYRIETFDPHFYEDGSNDFNTNPVDERDLYTSVKTQTSNESTYNYDTPTSFTVTREYRNYKTWQIFSNSQPSDFIGETKLTKEFYSSSLESNYKIVEYEFDKGSSYTIPPPLNYTVFNGSFLDTKITEKLNGISKITSCSYSYLNNFLGNGKFNNPVSQKITIDPYSNKTIQTYYNDTLTSQYFFDGLYYSYFYTEYYKNYFLNVPLQTEKRDGGNNLLYKEIQTYVTDRNSSLGYIMQPINKKIFDVTNEDNYLNYDYTYSKYDTTGKHLYGNRADLVPGKEGNLLTSTDAMGNIKKYYYHPISASEQIQFGDPDVEDNEGVQTSNIDNNFTDPQISYKKVFENGSTQIVSSKWQDRRLPTRVDSYTSQDNYLTEYMNYDLSGNVTKCVNNNGYIGVLSYDPLDRIANSVFPYDFNNTYTYDSLTYDTVITNIDKYFGSNEWGSYDLITGQQFTTNYAAEVGYKHFEVYSGGYGNGTVNNYVARMGFSTSELAGVYDVSLAEFIFYPTYYSHNIGGDTSYQNFKLQVRPVTNYGTPSLSDGSPTNISNVNTVNGGSYNWGDLQTDCYNNINVTTSLRDFLVTQNKTLNGIIINFAFNNISLPEPLPSYNVFLDIGSTVIPTNFWYVWRSQYSPRLHIVAKKRKIYPRIVKVYARGTFRYAYNDAQNKVESFYKMYNTSSGEVGKKTGYTFDGFYNLKQTNIYTNPTQYNTSYVDYNYLDKAGRTTDARGNQTKLSYDQYFSNSKVENADNSHTTNGITFQNSLVYTFGTVPGLIQKQTFTDEEGNSIDKYTDVMGNLRREVRFIEYVETPATIPELIPLITDYKYDNLYRVIEVRTPEDKRIYYLYDGLGRQIQRQTPDAGTVIYKYDKNGNLRFSQDDNQAHAPSQYRTANRITFRRYDGLNRTLSIGEAINEDKIPVWNDLNPNIVESFETFADFPEHFLTINVYDTLTSTIAEIFTPPSDYYNAANNTKGTLVATAYRTRSTDPWNYKYYRYDARGRTIKMWNVIDGLDTKITEYVYNSQNQMIVFGYQSGQTDGKVITYNYDDAGRLKDVNIPSAITIEPGIEDGPGYTYYNFASYTYNQNSQIASLKYNSQTNNTNYAYNNRNWCYQAGSNNFLVWQLNFLPNGNISHLLAGGSYNNNFFDNSDFSINYTYDKANRLTHSSNSPSTFVHALSNTYDKDGNILTLNRSNNGDNFNYQYITNTNKLRRVSGSTDQFTYDFNGNLKTDELNKNYDAVYDHRNLLIYISSVRSDPSSELPQNVTYVTRYYYDEAGNRTRKMTFKSTSRPVDPPDWESHNDSGRWTLVTDEYYVRDLSGKEIANYTSGNLNFWNIYGTDNVGRINADTTKQFYMKDHLGSTRAITNSSNILVSANDYDAWGYLLREWNSGNAKYKFTGKERDNETSYDYFGVRYFDSRIGRWGGVDKMFEKDIYNSSYVYCGNNPLIYIDEKGLWKVYYKNGEEVGREDEGWFANLFRDTYYVQGEGGSTEYNGEKYYEALSEATVKQTAWNNVEENWTTSKEGFQARVNDALGYYYDYPDDYINNYDYVRKESPEGKSMDQKRFLNKKSLYIFNGIAMNYAEAGNAIWGAAIKRLGINFGIAQFGAEIYSLYANKHFDQYNEVWAYTIGYYNFDDKNYAFKNRNQWNSVP